VGVRTPHASSTAVPGRRAHHDAVAGLRHQALRGESPNGLSRGGAASIDFDLCVAFGHIPLVVGLVVAAHGRVDHNRLNRDVLGLARPD
jgi:hypothetical protein